MSAAAVPEAVPDCCRICFGPADDTERLIRPCACTGTMELVHITCHQRWLDIMGLDYCPICTIPLDVEAVDEQ